MKWTILVRVQPEPAYVLTTTSTHTLISVDTQGRNTHEKRTYVLRRYVRPLAGTSELTLLVTVHCHSDEYAASLPVK